MTGDCWLDPATCEWCFKNFPILEAVECLHGVQPRQVLNDRGLEIMEVHSLLPIYE